MYKKINKVFFLKLTCFKTSEFQNTFLGQLQAWINA